MASRLEPFLAQVAGRVREHAARLRPDAAAAGGRLDDLLPVH